MVVTWKEPALEGADSRVTVLSNRQPGDQFSLGVATVTYTARDQSSEIITDCSFYVEVIGKDKRTECK